MPPDKTGGRPGQGGPQNTAARTTIAECRARSADAYGAVIFPQHAKLLGESAISPEVAAARGYVSVDTKKRLEGLGFERWQRSVPGLLIPARRADGSVWGYQYRPDSPRVTKAGTVIKYETPKGQRNGVDIPPGARDSATDPAVVLLVTEGARKADAAMSAGLACVSLNGVWGWRGQSPKGGKAAVADWHDIALNGRRVALAFDSDTRTKPKVQQALAELGGYLVSKGAKVEYLHLPDPDGSGKCGLDDYLAHHTADELMALVRPELPAIQLPLQSSPEGGSNISGTPPEKPAPNVPALTIAQVEEVYARWLHDGDSVTTRVCHAVYVANMMLPGDPVWVFLVGESGQGKTERLAPLAGMPHVELASTLSGEAALLSATARKDRAEHAHGGLLRRIGDKGVLIIKDFTSILEMDRTARGQVLAALREVYDGRWDREVGAEGGQTLTWKGKCGVLAACTTAIDRAHAVMNDMGPRSLFVRLLPADPAQIGASALDHMGRETAMRSELTAATAGLLTHLSGQPHDTAPVRDGLIGLAALVALARSPVHRDWGGEVELVGDPEAPTRIIKQLGQIWRACGVLGLGRAESWEAVTRCALDSIPKLRGAVIRYLAARYEPADTTTVRIALAHPKRTVLRALEDLAAHNVVTRKSAGQGHADQWELSDRARSWITSTEGVPEMLEPPRAVDCTICGEPLAQVLIDLGHTDHGEGEAA